MAFMIRNIIDLKGILFLILLTVPSIVTTNIDCNGKAFHCVNSTHFMICVDLGTGLSTTIDDVTLPCPLATICRPTNRFECEFREPTISLPPTTAITPTETIQSQVTIFNPEVVTSHPFEEYFNTLSPNTISESELRLLSTTDSFLAVELDTKATDITKTTKSENVIVDTAGISNDANIITIDNLNTNNGITVHNLENLSVIPFEGIAPSNGQEIHTVTDISGIRVNDSFTISTDKNVTITDQTETSEQILTTDIQNISVDATTSAYFSSLPDIWTIDPTTEAKSIKSTLKSQANIILNNSVSPIDASLTLETTVYPFTESITKENDSINSNTENSSNILNDTDTLLTKDYIEITTTQTFTADEVHSNFETETSTPVDILSGVKLNSNVNVDPVSDIQDTAMASLQETQAHYTSSVTPATKILENFNTVINNFSSGVDYVTVAPTKEDTEILMSLQSEIQVNSTSSANPVITILETKANPAFTTEVYTSSFIEAVTNPEYFVAGEDSTVVINPDRAVKDIAVVSELEAQNDNTSSTDPIMTTLKTNANTATTTEALRTFENVTNADYVSAGVDSTVTVNPARDTKDTVIVLELDTQVDNTSSTNPTIITLDTNTNTEITTEALRTLENVTNSANFSAGVDSTITVNPAREAKDTVVVLELDTQVDNTSSTNPTIITLDTNTNTEIATEALRTLENVTNSGYFSSGVDSTVTVNPAREAKDTVVVLELDTQADNSSSTNRIIVTLDTNTNTEITTEALSTFETVTNPDYFSAGVDSTVTVDSATEINDSLHFTSSTTATSITSETKANAASSNVTVNDFNGRNSEAFLNTTPYETTAVITENNSELFMSNSEVEKSITKATVINTISKNVANIKSLTNAKILTTGSITEGLLGNDFLKTSEKSNINDERQITTTHPDITKEMVTSMSGAKMEVFTTSISTSRNEVTTEKNKGLSQRDVENINNVSVTLLGDTQLPHNEKVLSTDNVYEATEAYYVVSTTDTNNKVETISINTDTAMQVNGLSTTTVSSILEEAPITTSIIKNHNMKDNLDKTSLQIENVVEEYVKFTSPFLSRNTISTDLSITSTIITLQKADTTNSVSSKNANSVNTESEIASTNAPSIHKNSTDNSSDDSLSIVKEHIDEFHLLNQITTLSPTTVTMDTNTTLPTESIPLKGDTISTDITTPLPSIEKSTERVYVTSAHDTIDKRRTQSSYPPGMSPTESEILNESLRDVLLADISNISTVPENQLTLIVNSSELSTTVATTVYVDLQQSTAKLNENVDESKVASTATTSKIVSSTMLPTEVVKTPDSATYTSEIALPTSTQNDASADKVVENFTKSTQSDVNISMLNINVVGSTPDSATVSVDSNYFNVNANSRLEATSALNYDNIVTQTTVVTESLENFGKLQTSTLPPEIYVTDRVTEFIINSHTPIGYQDSILNTVTGATQTTTETLVITRAQNAMSKKNHLNKHPIHVTGTESNFENATNSSADLLLNESNGMVTQNFVELTTYTDLNTMQSDIPEKIYLEVSTSSNSIIIDPPQTALSHNKASDLSIQSKMRSTLNSKNDQLQVEIIPINQENLHVTTTTFNNDATYQTGTLSLISMSPSNEMKPVTYPSELAISHSNTELTKQSVDKLIETSDHILATEKMNRVNDVVNNTVSELQLQSTTDPYKISSILDTQNKEMPNILNVLEVTEKPLSAEPPTTKNSYPDNVSLLPQENESTTSTAPIDLNIEMNTKKTQDSGMPKVSNTDHTQTIDQLPMEGSMKLRSAAPGVTFDTNENIHTQTTEFSELKKGTISTSLETNHNPNLLPKRKDTVSATTTEHAIILTESTISGIVISHMAEPALIVPSTELQMVQNTGSVLTISTTKRPAAVETNVKSTEENVPKNPLPAYSREIQVPTDIVIGTGVIEDNKQNKSTHSGSTALKAESPKQLDNNDKSKNNQLEVQKNPTTTIHAENEETVASVKDLYPLLIQHNSKDQNHIGVIETLIKTKGNHNVSINKNEGGNKENSTYKNNDNTKDIFSQNKEKAPHEVFTNSTTPGSHTSNNKSRNQNNTFHAHTTVISSFKSSTPRYSSQTKSTSTGDGHTTEFPAFVTSTRTPNLNFDCKQKRGRYADKQDCRKFYFCLGKGQAIQQTCPVNTVFSEIRKQCTTNLSHCIRNNQFQCVTEGRFSDFLNNNVYYICVKNNVTSFIRFKLSCLNGYYLNRTSVRCVLNDKSEQSSQNDSSKSSSDQSGSAAKREEKEKLKQFECTKEGKFPDPSDCQRYFECKKNDSDEYRQRRRKCGSEKIFHKDKKKCVESDSYECN